jgi:bifunctional DNA-binding transcriptional regulator/antitoxin component of YhaV-PrlF toxin-antitoxin module
MKSTRLSSKGQINLPKSVRDMNRWPTGTDFSVEDTGAGVLPRPLKTTRVSPLQDVVGCLPVKGPARTLEEMDAAIDNEVRDRRDRGRH